MARTPAQIEAQKKYDKKRKNRPLFSVRMSEEEKQYCHDVLDQFAPELSKKDALIKAIKSIDKNA